MATVTHPRDRAASSADVAHAHRRLSRTVTYLVLGAIAATVLIPFVAMVIHSLRPETVAPYPFRWIPQQVTIANYAHLFRNTLILRWTWNSLAIAGGVSLLHVLTCSLAAYAFARKEFPGRQAIFWVLMLQVILPYQVTLIPLFVLLTKWKLTNTYLAFWLPFATSVFGTFLLTQALKTIPREFDEAARIDGCSDFAIYWRVLLPMIRPSLTVLAVFSFILQWNDFLYPLIMTHSNSMRTLQVGLAALRPQGGVLIGAELGILMAGATYAFMPTMLLFLALQQYIVTGLVAGGLKG
jgi:multiple sugar transport system permease protein